MKMSLTALFACHGQTPTVWKEKVKSESFILESPILWSISGQKTRTEGPSVQRERPAKWREHARATETRECPEKAYTQGQGNFLLNGWYVSCLECKLEKLTVF